MRKFHQCHKCSTSFTFDDPAVAPVPADILLMLQSGDVVPSGICPDCKNLCSCKETFDSSEESFKARIPEITLTALNSYIKEHSWVGDFLLDVLSCDYHGIVGRADDDNKKALYYILLYVSRYAPGESWGSREKVMEWLGAGKVESRHG